MNHEPPKTVPPDGPASAIVPTPSGLSNTIKLLMRRHNVDERNQATLIASLIGASPLQIRRRLAGISGSWAFEEVLAIASHFGESIDTMMTFGGVEQKKEGTVATLDVDGISLRCQVWLGPPVDSTYTKLCAALIPERGWVLGKESKLKRLGGSVQRFTVDRLEYIDDSIADVRVAILDDDLALAYSLQNYFEEIGYQARAFNSVEELQEHIKDHDAFIIDYQLKGHLNCMALVKKIRGTLPAAPILVLTGQLKVIASDQREQDAMTLTRVMGAQIHYKPTDSAQLANAIQGAITGARRTAIEQ